MTRTFNSAIIHINRKERQSICRLTDSKRKRNKIPKTSGLKKKIAQIRKEYEEESKLISDAIHKVVPGFGRLMDMCGSYGGYGY